MKKKVFISFIIILFLLMICGIVLVIFLNERDNRISLIKDEVVIEYGNTYNPNIEELIDTSKYDFINLKEVRIENNIEKEENKDYPAVGEYEVNVYYKRKALKQKVEVKDTVAPELSIKENIEIPFNTDLSTYNFKELINVSDLSEIKEYDINLNNINSNESGEYTAIVKVEDIYSNKTEKEFKVIIQEEPKQENIDNSSNTQTNTTTNISKPNTSSSTKDNKNKSTSNNNVKTNTNNANTIQIEKETKKEDKQETTKQQVPVRCSNNNNHGMDVGNSNKWFATKNEAISYYNSQTSYWGKRWENFEIEDDVYYKNCPYRLRSLELYVLFKMDY